LPQTGEVALLRPGDQLFNVRLRLRLLPVARDVADGDGLVENLRVEEPVLHRHVVDPQIEIPRPSLAALGRPRDR
jgi:hypothetical protein